MDVTIYYIDGSRSYRNHVTLIEELQDGSILIRTEHPLDEEAMEQYFNPDHIARMSVRRGDSNDDSDNQEEDI